MYRTEMRNPATTHIDTASVGEALQMLQNENINAVNAVGSALPSIELACESIIEGLNLGGRLIYIGAGTSGRLGVIDATECPPTYGVPPELVVGIIAGGDACMFRSSENAEDSAESGVRDISAKQLRPCDRVVGISAAGDAAYVAAALEFARGVGCVTIGVTSNPGSRLDRESDISIVADTGPEAVTGSTRMKAGTAQKLILNMLSTCSMIKTGRVYENLMVNLRPTNEKLRRRVISIVMDIADCGENEAVELLERHDWSIRGAVESLKEAGK